MLALRSHVLWSSLTMIHLGAESEEAVLLGIPAEVSQTRLIPVANFRGEDFMKFTPETLGPLIGLRLLPASPAWCRFVPATSHRGART